MGLPILNELLTVTLEFFKSHKYLRMTLALILLFFVANKMAVFIASFNVACTLDGVPRELNSFTVAPTLTVLDLALDEYYSKGTDAEEEIEEGEFSIFDTIGSLSGIIRKIHATILGATVIEQAVDLEGNVTPSIRDSYLIAHSRPYETDFNSFAFEDLVQYGCRDSTPTVTVARIDILNAKLWFLIFAIGELMILKRWRDG